MLQYLQQTTATTGRTYECHSYTHIPLTPIVESPRMLPVGKNGGECTHSWLIDNNSMLA